MKLWIIYKDGIGFSKILADILQDRLEEYVDVSVGSAKKVDPEYVIEENIDFLIIGDTITDGVPSAEIQNWLTKYRESSEKQDFIVKASSGFYIVTIDGPDESLWRKSLKKNVKSERFLPPIMQLKVDKTNLVIEKGAIEIVKKFSNDIMDFLIEING